MRARRGKTSPLLLLLLLSSSSPSPSSSSSSTLRCLIRDVKKREGDGGGGSEAEAVSQRDTDSDVVTPRHYLIHLPPSSSSLLISMRSPPSPPPPHHQPYTKLSALWTFLTIYVGQGQDRLNRSASSQPPADEIAREKEEGETIDSRRHADLFPPPPPLPSVRLPSLYSPNGSLARLSREGQEEGGEEAHQSL